MQESIVELAGKTVLEAFTLNDKTELILKLDTGETVIFYHDQDCCESVSIEDINGDLEDLVGTPLIHAEVTSESNEPTESYESSTWTFYKFATIKGYVTVRWFGYSNGYYSESVSMKVLPAEVEYKNKYQ